MRFAVRGFGRGCLAAFFLARMILVSRTNSGSGAVNLITSALPAVPNVVMVQMTRPRSPPRPGCSYKQNTQPLRSRLLSGLIGCA